jgi:hypothetical protein
MSLHIDWVSTCRMFIKPNRELKTAAEDIYGAKLAKLQGSRQVQKRPHRKALARYHKVSQTSIHPVDRVGRQA